MTISCNHAGNGHIGHCNQGNNMYLFPGLVYIHFIATIFYNIQLMLV